MKPVRNCEEYYKYCKCVTFSLQRTDYAFSFSIFSKDQKEAIKALQLEHKPLAAAGVALENANIPFHIAVKNGPMPAGVSPLYSGNSRQKSMNFYVSGGYKLLNEWNLNSFGALAVGRYFPKFPNDFEQFQKVLDNIDSLIKSFDDYLMFCSFLINEG